MGDLKLDAKNRKILAELDFNAREPVSAIAKKVRLSQEVVNYRIKQLEKAGVIKGYYTVIDMTRLGYMFCRLFVKFQHLTAEKEKEFIAYAKSHDSVGWIVTVEGRWDLALVIYARNIYELKNISDEIENKFSGIVKEKYVTIATKIYHFKNNFLFGTNDYSQLIVGEEPVIEKLDKIDFEILHLLLDNAKLSLVEIAKKVNLTANAVKHRVKILMNKKIILGFRTVFNYSMLGYQHQKVFLYTRNLDNRKKIELIEYLRSQPNVTYITEAVGKTNFEFEMLTQNSTATHQFMRQLKNAFPAIIEDYAIELTCEERLVRYLPKVDLTK